MLLGNQKMLFGQRVKERRIELNLTQVALANLVGIHQSTIQRIEKGTHKRGTAYSIDLALALKVSPEWLVKGKDDSSTNNLNNNNFHEKNNLDLLAQRIAILETRLNTLEFGVH